MTKERFAEILREYGYSEDTINNLWITRPEDDIDEERLRGTAVDYMEMEKEGRRISDGI